MNNTEFTIYDKQESRLPKYMGIGAALLSVVALAFVFDDSLLKNLFSFGSSGKVIAKVVRADNDIRRRTLKEIAWYSLDNNEDVYENDMIFSGRDSSASVQFNDGSNFDIEQNSLVIFKNKDGVAELSLKYGKFEGQIAPGKKVNVVIGGKSKTLTSNGKAKIVIEKNGDKTELKVVGGVVSLDNKLINTNQKLEILDSGVEGDIRPVSLDLIKPLNQEKIWLKKEDPLQFAWSQADPKSKYNIKVSRKKSLAEPVFETFLDSQTSLGVNTLTPGRYYWQVSTTDKQKATSEIYEFKVYPETAPRLIYPPDGTLFQLPRKSAQDNQQLTQPVTFSFEDNSNAESFLFEVANDPEFTAPLMSQTVAQTRLDNIPLPTGDYFWRVKVIDSHRVNSDWSAPGYFSVKDKLMPLDKPVLLSSKSLRYTIPPQNAHPELYTAEDSEVSEFLQKNLKDLPVVEFNDVEQAEKYEIQVSSSYLFSSGVTKRFISPKARFKLTPVFPGKHFVRVRAINTLHPFSPPSDTISTQILVSPPVVVGQNTYITEDVKENPAVNIQWSPRVFAKGYELQVASNDQFVNHKRIVTQNTRFEVPVSPGETYFYRVRALDSEKRPISLFSKIDTKKYIVKQPIRQLASKKPEKPKPQKQERERLRSPASLMVPISAQFANWPKWNVELGSFSGLADYQSTFSEFSLSNEDLNQNKSFYISAYYAIKPKILLDAYYEVINGETTDAGAFNTTWTGVGGRYRFWGNLNYGLAAFVGGGFEYAKYFRFGFESDISDTLVNRPISMGSMYFTSGIEWRSYFQLRGMLSFSYYQGLFAKSNSADTTEFAMTASNQYSVDATVAHSFTENSYLGIGLRYRLINYGFTSNEFGDTETGEASTSHLLFRVFVGAEQ